MKPRSRGVGPVNDARHKQTGCVQGHSHVGGRQERGGAQDSRKELVTRRNDLSRKLACWSPSGFFTLSMFAGGSKVSTTLPDKDGRLRAREPLAAPHQVSAARCARFLLRMYL